MKQVLTDIVKSIVDNPDEVVVLEKVSGDMSILELSVAKEDMGKVLGMELRPRLNGRPLVVLDELKLADGDYLDMGKPLYQGGVVPITIKSLAFSG